VRGCRVRRYTDSYTRTPHTSGHTSEYFTGHMLCKGWLGRRAQEDKTHATILENVALTVASVISLISCAAGSAAVFVPWSFTLQHMRCYAAGAVRPSARPVSERAHRMPRMPASL
jgi:hypothetical protein